MPNTNELVAALLNTVTALSSNGDAQAARTVANALNDGLTRAGLLDGPTQAPTSHTCRRIPKFNKLRTLHKDYGTAGFTDESLQVNLRSAADCDVITITAANDFRRYYREVPMTRGFRIDRSTFKAQLRLGVLKITGRTYLRDMAPYEMDLSPKTIRPVMKPNE